MAVAQLLPAGPLSTSGNQIVDQFGNPVRIASIGWNSYQRNTAPDGLYAVNYQALLNQVKSIGFNCIRIGFCDASVINNDFPAAGTINFGLNPGMQGLSMLQCFDLIITYAGNIGLRIILDSHNSEGRSHSFSNANGIWFDSGPGSDGTDGAGNTGTVTDAAYRAMWANIANRYKTFPAMLGYDLRNEPNTTGVNGNGNGGGSDWGTGSNRDLRAMYQAVGNSILAIDPRVLIICEGPQNYTGTFATGTAADGINYGTGSTFFGNSGDLSGTRQFPVTLTTPNKVLYSVHEYPPETTGAAHDAASATKIANMTAIWGFLVKNNTAPVWIGELGSYFNGTAAQIAESTAWANMMVSYCNGATAGGPTFAGGKQGISTSWWDLAVDNNGNPNQVPDFGILTAWSGGAARANQFAIYSQLQFTGGVTNPNPNPIASPNGTVVTTVGPAITDANGHLWTITAGGQVAVDGIADATTGSVIELAYISGLIWQENASLLWWSKTVPADTWSPPAGTTTSPIGAAPVASPNGTIVTTVGPAIVDANGHLWTITAGAQVAVDGVADTTTANVIELAFVGNQVWQENGSLLWWSKTLPTDVWSPPAGTTVSPLATGAARVVRPLTGAVVPGNWVVNQRLTVAAMPNGVVGYQILYPHGYSATDHTKLWPLFVYLHENGEGGNPYPRTDGANFVNQPEINGAFNTVAWRTEFPCIVIAMLCDQTIDGSGQNPNSNFGGYNDSPNSGGNEQGLNALVAWALANTNADPTAILGSGDSLGAIGILANAIDNNRYNGANRYWSGVMCLSDQLFRPTIPNNATLFNSIAAVPIIAVSTPADNVPSSFDQPAYTFYSGGSTSYPTKAAYDAGGVAAIRAGSSNFYYISMPSGVPWNSSGGDFRHLNADGGDGTALYELLWSFLPTATAPPPVVPPPPPTPTLAPRIKVLDPRVQNPPQTFTDNTGVVWNISLDCVVVANGVKDGTTFNVAAMVLDTSGIIYHENTNGQWFSKARQADAWAFASNPMPAGQAIRSYDLTRTFGYNIHVDSGGQSNPTLLINAFNYLGSTLARQQAYQGSTNLLALSTGIVGMRFDFLGMLAYTSDFDGSGTSSGGPAQVPWNVHDTITNQLAQTGLASFFAIEGQNEPNLFNSIGNPSHPGTQAGWIAGNAGYAAAVTAIAGVAAVPVMGAPLGNVAANGGITSAFGNVTGLGIDWGVEHLYPNDGAGGGVQFFGNPNGATQYLADTNVQAPGRPRCLTEIGYGIGGANGSHVTGIAFGKIMLNAFLDSYLIGSAGTFNFEVFDDSAEGLFLISGAGVPNQAATIIHNFTTIIADAGATKATFDPGALSYSISGTGYHQCLVQVSADTFHLILWNDVPVQTTGASPVDVTPAALNLTVNLTQAITSAAIFDPTVSTLAQSTFAAVSSIPISLFGGPKVISITAVPATVTTPGTSVSGGRSFFNSPGENGTYWVDTFKTTALWITSGPLVTALRNGSHGVPTGVVNIKGQFATPWVRGFATDPLVTVTDGTRTELIRIPLGTQIETPVSAFDQSIGGADATRPYFVWSISQATMKNGVTGATITAVQAQNTVITGALFCVQDGAGQMMMDIETGTQGLNNAFGNIQDYELTLARSDPNYFPQHMLAFLLDKTSQVSGAGPIWPLAVVDLSGANTGPIPQGITIGIPSSIPMPAGETRGFQFWWKMLQQFGAQHYNVADSGATVLNVYSTDPANAALVTDLQAAWTRVIASVCILDYVSPHVGAQYSIATQKGMASGGTDAFPQPAGLDLTATGGVNVAPSTFGAWYPNVYNRTPVNAPPANPAVPTAGPPSAVWNIHGGITSWTPNTAVTKGQRLVNIGIAYECVLSGTTAAAGGPQTTSGNILDGSARWKFISNADFFDRSGAVAALPAAFTSALTHMFWNDRPQTTTASIPFATLTGHAMPVGTSLTLTAPPSDSLRTALASQSLPLISSTSYGSTFLQPLAPSAATNYFIINDPVVSILALQFIDPQPDSASSVLSIGAGNTVLVVRNCIIDGASQTALANLIELGTSGTVLFVNCLVIDRQVSSGVAPTIATLAGTQQATFLHCTFVAVNAPAGAAPFGTTTGGIARNCVFAGYGAVGSSGMTFDHCATTAASFGSGTDGGGNIFNTSAAVCFVSATTDFRLPPGSPLLNAGVVDLVNNPANDDIAGTLRKQGANPDIGCWERVSFAVQEFRVPPSKFW